MTELRLWNRSLTFVSYSCERGECARCTESLRKKRLPVESLAPICTHECHNPPESPEVIY